MSACSTESSPEPQEQEHDDTASQNGSDAQSARASVTEDTHDSSGPPLPTEEPPPLPSEAPPGQAPDDGWDPVWDGTAHAFYFYNRFTKLTQWENPRIPAVTEPTPPGVGNYDRIAPTPTTAPPPTAVKPSTGGYDPAIHGDYDPTADYAQPQPNPDPSTALLLSPHPAGNPTAEATTTTTTTNTADPYAATGTFNRFTGKWQAAALNPDAFNDENKSKRQMNAYFDVDTAANSHDGKSLKAERSGKKLSKKELKAFKEKRRERKEEKRRAWLRD